MKENNKCAIICSSTSKNVVKVEVGNGTVFAMLSNGETWGWGNNISRQIGNERASSTLTSNKYFVGNEITDISVNTSIRIYYRGGDYYYKDDTGSTIIIKEGVSSIVANSFTSMNQLTSIIYVGTNFP